MPSRLLLLLALVTLYLGPDIDFSQMSLAQLCRGASSTQRTRESAFTSPQRPKRVPADTFSPPQLEIHFMPRLLALRSLGPSAPGKYPCKTINTCFKLGLHFRGDRCSRYCTNSHNISHSDVLPMTKPYAPYQGTYAVQSRLQNPDIALELRRRHGI